MSYNTTLQSNNIDLQAILNTINELPEVNNSLVLQDKIIVPTTSSQTIVADFNYDGLNSVIVNAIPSSYVQPTTTKGATTYTPTTANQTIASGTYLTGAQTIKGDSNLVASNIKSGVSIFGVNGTLEEGGGGSTVVDDVSKAIIERTVTEINDDSIKAIGSYAFADCYSLTTASFPNVTTIGGYAFRACSRLTTASFPNVTTIDDYTFAYCDNLTTASFPNVTTISGFAFYGCDNLTTISFPVATTIGIRAFQYCSKLTSFYLTGSSIPTLSNINTFWNTPMSVSTYTGSFGSIFVPAFLVASYKTATNWATYADRITSIPIITFTINGTEYQINDTEYQAEDGMTWEQWVESNYNIGGFYLNGSKVTNGYSIEDVQSDDVIIDGGVYTLSILADSIW